MAARVLIADDEPKIVRLVAAYLEAEGFETISAFDGEEALRKVQTERPDCVILDISMPKMDGLEVAREIRRDSEVPILFLSARAEETDRIVGLALGGDDYVVKPFSPRELVARVRAILRRTRWTTRASISGARSRRVENRTVLRAGAVSLDMEKRRVTVEGKPKNLTALQFDLLKTLLREPGRVFSRLELLEVLSGSAYEGYERTIDAHIKNLRKALGDDAESPRYIGTIRGVGYSFLEQPETPNED
ncbi:MAG: response regulator transcription factor [Spirochaetales bacterium]